MGLAAVDSAATKSVISPSTVDRGPNGPRSVANDFTVTFANGTKENSNEVLDIGPIEAVVVPNLQTDLISVKDLVDHGNTIVFSSDNPVIRNDRTGVEIPMTPVDNGTWVIDLKEIERLPSRNHNVNGITHCDANATTTKAEMTLKKNLIKLHCRMGHPSIEFICAAIKEGQWTNSGFDGENLRGIWDNYQCPACLLAGRNAIPTPIASGERTTVVGHTISTDPVPVSPASEGGEKWIFIFKDVASGYLHTIIGKAKSEYPSILEGVIKWYSDKGHSVSIVRSDSEGVLSSMEVKEILTEFKIEQQYSVPYHHYQNPVEREVQTMGKGVAALLHDQYFVKANKWPYAVEWWTALRNRTPNKNTNGLTPHFLVTGETTNVSNTFNFQFGEIVAVGIPKIFKSWKFDLKRDVGIYLGQPVGSVNGHLILNPYDFSVKVRGDVIAMDISDEVMNKFYTIKSNLHKSSDPYPSLFKICELADLETVTSESTPVLEFTSAIAEPTRRITRSQTNVLPEATDLSVNNLILSQNIDMGDFDKEYPCFIHAVRVKTEDSPSVKMALRGLQREQWIEAIKSEVYTNLIGSGTLEAVEFEDIPSGESKTVMTFVMKKKYYPDGTVDKFKARGCFRGDLVNDDLTETYSPTIGALTYALVQNIAIIDDMQQCLVDTVGAFLAQTYPDDAVPLYVRFDDDVASICGIKKRQWFRIRKFLYGIKNAGRAYYMAYSGLLIANNYCQSTTDPCLFYRIDSSGKIYIWIHVDDSYVCGSSQKLLTEFVDVVQLKYQVTIKDTVENYIGVHLETLANGSVKRSQPKLLADLINKHDVRELSVVKSPAPYAGTKQKDNTPFSSTEYLRLLGSLLYLLASRPDVSFAVSFAATKSNNPTVSDWVDLVRILQYLCYTEDYGLIIEKQQPNCPLTLFIHVDASYLLHADSKAQTGYAMSLNNQGFFYIKSSKQSVVTTSSTHSEMRALFTSVCEFLYAELICQEIGRPLTLPTVIYEDNQPVITLLNRERALHKGSKHFLMLINYVRDLIAEGKVDVKKVSTDENVADILTKNVSGQDFAYKCQEMLGRANVDAPELPKNAKNKKTRTI